MSTTIVCLISYISLAPGMAARIAGTITHTGANGTQLCEVSAGESMTAAAFVQAARNLKGARWRHRGRKPWAVDCIGLVVLAARAAGLSLEDEMYGRQHWNDRLRQGLRARFGDPVNDWLPGDIAVVHFRDRDHVGILGDKPDGLTLIHCLPDQGVLEHSIDERYRSLISEVFRPWQS